jgi:hypothetical protein
MRLRGVAPTRASSIYPVSATCTHHSTICVFGKGVAPVPAKVGAATPPVCATQTDGRRATIPRQPARNSEFLVVRLGARPEELTQNYQVYDHNTSLAVASLNVKTVYYFAVNAINECCIANGQAAFI